MTPTPRPGSLVHRALPHLRRPLGRARRALSRAMARTRSEGSGAVPTVVDRAARGPAPVTGDVTGSGSGTELALLLAEGRGLPAAVLEAASGLHERNESATAVSLGYALLEDPSTSDLGRLVLGVSRSRSSKPGLAWADLGQVDALPLLHAAGEGWFRPAFALEPDRAADRLRSLMDRQLHRSWSGTTLVRVARAAFAAGDDGLTRSLIDDVLSARGLDLGTHHRRELSRLASWLPDGQRRAPVPDLRADVRVGVLNYHQPDVSSRNVGDWIQTLASLGHLVRHRNLRFVGDDAELVHFVESIAQTTKPQRWVEDGPARTVQLVEVQRDAMPYQQLPDPTWVLAFGWFMHPTFDAGFGFPFPEQVRPIFVSFHLNKPDMLDDEAIAYLRDHAPVGCRDWQTVVALRQVGVPAFFSGCMTTTVDTVFLPGDPGLRTRVGHVDHPGEGEGEVIEQTITDLRRRSFADNLAMARDWVGDYNTVYRKLFTSRLHCNLPARSVGAEVVFEPKNRSDVRFGGLIDTDDAAFDAIRDGILDKLEAVLSLVLAGAEEQEVYARWREVCAADVEEAGRHLDRMSLDLPDAPAVGTVLPGVRRAVVVDVAPGEAPHLESLLRRLSRAVPQGTGVVLAGDETLRAPRTADELGAAAGLPVALVNRGSVDVDGWRPDAARRRGLRHDLLLAAALRSVADCDRVVLLPAAVLLRDDLGPLFDLDLAGRPLAAPLDPRRDRRLGSSLARGVSARQGDDAAAALSFLAATAGTVAPRQVPFDPVVMVLDPAALADAGGDAVIPMMLRYRASLREALNVLLGERWTALPPEWATMVHLQTPGDDASLLSYRVGTKPWSRLVTAGRQEWLSERDGLR